MNQTEGNSFYNHIFQYISNINNIEHCSRNTAKGALFDENCNQTVSGLLKRPVFEKSEGNWINILQSITKQYENRILSSTKLTPIQASLKKNEGFTYKILSDKRKKIKQKFQINNSVRVADLNRVFSKGNTINCSYKLYKITAIINDTIPSFRNNNLPERHNEASLKKINLTIKEKKRCYEKSQFYLAQVRSKSPWLSELILTSLFVETSANPFVSLRTTPSNLNSTLIGWEAVNFCRYLLSKPYKL